jgi:peptide/nickel transport system substrate-binding protein
MNRRWIVAASAAAAALLAAGCSSSGSGSSSSSTAGSSYVSGGTFTMDISSDPGTVSPYQSTEGSARQIYAFGYDTLLGKTSSGTEVPELATKWTTTLHQVTFTLHQGVKCDDGSTLTASDVAADFNSIKNPKTLSPWLSFTIPVSYTVSSDNQAGTVTITTAKADGLLAAGAGELPIVCPAGLSSPDSIAHKFDGTGPFQVTAYSPDNSYTMTVRKGYDWGPNGASTSTAGTPAKVVLDFVDDETTEANQLLAGDINAAQVSGSDATRLTGLKTATITTLAGELYFNEESGNLLADKDLRTALAEAIDIPAVTKVGTGGLGKVATNMEVETPPPCPGDTTSALPAYNVSAAKALLTSDGWVVGSGGIRAKDGKKLAISLPYQTGSEQTVDAVELIAQEWKAIGVQVTLPGYEEAQWTQMLTVTGNYNVFYSSINLDSPFQYSDFFGGPSPSDGGDNFGHIDNTQFDSLSAQALGTSGTAGCTLWNDAQKALMARADVVPISVLPDPFYLHDATMEAVGVLEVPSSIRLLAS